MAVSIDSIMRRVRQLVRPATLASSELGTADRRFQILQGLDLGALTGLEFGPLTTPLVTKDSSNICYIDHDTSDNLKKKYSQDPNVNINRIVEVDFISDGRSLVEIVEGRRFDYILASHVFEHVPNPIKWLNDCSSVLNPGGQIRLALPDRNYTFDFFRNETRLHEWIGAFLNDLSRPSPATVFENAVLCNGYEFAPLFKGQRSPTFIEEVDPMWALSLAEAAKDRYIDVHCSVFTPDSFKSLVKKSGNMKLHNFEISHISSTASGTVEFFVHLHLGA